MRNLLLDAGWRTALEGAFAAASFARLESFVEAAYRAGVVYPPRNLIFEAFNRTPFDKVKVVILGQDPYHNPDEAHGLAFSVRDGVRLPPSLANVFKELQAEFPEKSFVGRSGDLTRWAEAGVLLLNATLTVAGGHGTALSHQKKGWEDFTDAAIQALAAKREHLVYLLWGASAQRKAAFVDSSQNLVLKSAHPSPLSAYRGFFGCGHFRAANDYLAAHNLAPIDW